MVSEGQGSVPHVGAVCLLDWVVIPVDDLAQVTGGHVHHFVQTSEIACLCLLHEGWQ